MKGGHNAIGSIKIKYVHLYVKNQSNRPIAKIRKEVTTCTPGGLNAVNRYLIVAERGPAHHRVLPAASTHSYCSSMRSIHLTYIIINNVESATPSST